MVLEAVIEQSHIGEAIKKFACKIALEKLAGKSPVIDFNGRGIVILADQDILPAVTMQQIINFRQLVGIDVNQYAADKGQIKNLI